MEKIWLKNYPAGVSQEIDPSQYTSLVDAFDEAIKKFPDLLSFTNMGKGLTYAELDQLTDQFASFLQNELGLKKGDRIALQMPNLLQFPVALFGSLKAGLTVVNTNPLYTTREMSHQFKDSGAKALVILENFASLYQEIKDHVPIENVIVAKIGDMLGFPKGNIVNFAVKHIKKMVPAYDLPKAYSFGQTLAIGSRYPGFRRPQLGHDDIAFLQYTGGTTGIAKGAMLSHRNIIANMMQISEWMKTAFTPGKETVITPLPLYHIFSLTVNCMSFMRFGATNLLITNPKDIGGFIKTLRSETFTVMTGVNTLFNALMNHPELQSIDFSNLKMSVAGGMALQTDVALRWKDTTNSPIFEGFGLTETSPVACCNPINGGDRVGTIGLPLPSTEVMVVDDDGNELAIGKEGELCIRGPQVMVGYWNRSDETENVMLANGWLKTGDIAVIDADGFTTIVDRKKDMILVSGFNVFPNEVEDIIMKMDQVVEVAVVGSPDDKSGEVVRAVIVSKDSTLQPQQVIDHCRESLTSYKVPKIVEFRDELPKTNVGKVLRRALRD